MTIFEIAKKVHSGEVKAADVAKEYLKRIEEKNNFYNVFLYINKDIVSQAKEIDERISKGENVGRLAGVPIAVKDNILVKGMPATAASKVLENFVAQSDATIIKKIIAEGALVIGKTNMDEFAMGSSTENSAFGPTKNPWDTARVPGGSSGGSAAAVALDFAPVAIGSDTGGSIRQPASFCGVIGFKPTYGAVSRYGLMEMASSLDQIGTFAKTSKEAQFVFDVIRGKDEHDTTTKDFKEKEVKKPRLGMVKRYFQEGLSTLTGKALNTFIDKLSKDYEIVDISLKHFDYALPCYYILMPAEVSSNMARYTGERYGKSADFLGEEVKRRVLLGNFVLSYGFFDAYYRKSKAVQAKIKKELEEAFEKVDFILIPTSPTEAFKIGEKTSDPISMYLADVFTVTANIANIPALSFPLNGDGEYFWKNPKGLPVGIQILGPQFSDDNIFEFSKKFEK